MKNAKFKSVYTISVAPIIALCLAMPYAHAQSTPSAAPTTSMPHDMKKGMMGPDDMKKSMMMGMDNMQKMAMSGDMDKDFAMMMKMHHQQALDMAQMELANGKSPVMKTMAKNIISAQKKEIAAFDKWLAMQK